MSEELFFKDIKLSNRGFDVHTSDREGVSFLATIQSDIATVSGRDNLAQAVVNRLLTRKGELTSLGHPDYGSRLHELVGEPNNIRLQGLAEIYIRESLQAEKRIEDIRSIAFALPDRKQGRSELRIMIRIKPVGDAAEFSIVLPINL